MKTRGDRSDRHEDLFGIEIRTERVPVCVTRRLGRARESAEHSAEDDDSIRYGHSLLPDGWGNSSCRPAVILPGPT